MNASTTARPPSLAARAATTGLLATCARAAVASDGRPSVPNITATLTRATRTRRRRAGP